MKSKSRNVVTSATSRMIYVAVYTLILQWFEYCKFILLSKQLSFYENDRSKEEGCGQFRSSLKQKRQTLNRNDVQGQCVLLSSVLERISLFSCLLLTMIFFKSLYIKTNKQNHVWFINIIRHSHLINQWFSNLNCIHLGRGPMLKWKFWFMSGMERDLRVLQFFQVKEMLLDSWLHFE